MITRRQFLTAGMLAGTSLMADLRGRPIEWLSSEPHKFQLQKFLDPLPIPEVLRPSGRFRGSPLYDIPMTQFRQRLHSQLPATKLWGYKGVFPGPTLEVRRNEAVWVRWINDLPRHHLLNIDTKIHGAHDPANPDVRTVVHLHGGHVPSRSDGYPEAWFTPGNSDLYYYPNRQPPTTLWYHDHALGITRLNVYAGLAGLYLIRDEPEEKLNLPRGPHEIPLVIQDRRFTEDGQLQYPHHWMPMFFGNTALVNGRIWPFLEVEPRKYRFRFLNASNSRFYNLKLVGYHDKAGAIDLNLPGPAFYQIGSDGGFLPSPVLLNDPGNIGSPRLLLAPAERADVVIDFARYAGKSLALHNNARAPFRGLDVPLRDEAPLSQIMLFRIKPGPVSDASSLPSRLRPVPRLKPETAVLQRDLVLCEVLNEKGNPVKLLLNGNGWAVKPTETPILGTTEIWNLINLTGDVHPIHLHSVRFQVLNCQQFDVAGYKEKKKLVFTSAPKQSCLNQVGWKDTVSVNPGEVTRIIARFSGYSGLFVWHCHILEHEDNDMMRPLEVRRA
jgi:spore coat protein A